MFHLQGWSDSEYGAQFGTETGILEHTPPTTSIWANYGVLDGDDGWRPDNSPSGYRESKSRRATANSTAHGRKTITARGRP